VVQQLPSYAAPGHRWVDEQVGEFCRRRLPVEAVEAS